MRRLFALPLVALLAACSSKEGSSSASSASATANVTSSAAASAATPLPPPADVRATVHVGGALARGVGESALYVADEDHRAVRRVPLPLQPGATGAALELAGAPAQVLPRAVGTRRTPIRGAATGPRSSCAGRARRSAPCRAPSGPTRKAAPACSTSPATSTNGPPPPTTRRGPTASAAEAAGRTAGGDHHSRRLQDHLSLRLPRDSLRDRRPLIHLMQWVARHPLRRAAVSSKTRTTP